MTLPTDHPGVCTELPAEQVVEILAKRLGQLRDETWMRSVLERAVRDLAVRPMVVRDHHIEYCKIKPNRDINLVVVAQLETIPGGAPTECRFSGTVFPSKERGRVRFEEDGRQPLPDFAVHQLQARGFARPQTFLADPAMTVRVFPFDPMLPGLTRACDPDQMIPVLAAHGQRGGEGVTPSALGYEILHYKPCRSCTLHYRVDIGAATGPEPDRYQVYGKVYRDDRGEHNHRVLSEAWNACCASDGTWRSARPVAYIPEWRLLIQEAIPGTEFRVVFGELTHDDAGPEQLQQVERHLETIARAIRSLQSSPVPARPRNTFARLFADQEKNLTYLRGSEPRLAADLTDIRDELARLEREIPGNPLVYSHGDFAHGNVLIDGDVVGIVDFDKACAAEPAYDVAYFLTHMWSFGVRHPRRQRHVNRLWNAFRAAYLELAPEVSEARLALYEALDFAAYVLRNFRKQSHQANWMTWAEGQVQAAWERLAVAANRKGAAP